MAAASLGSSGNMPYKDEVDVRESPIPRLEISWSLKNLFDLKVSSWNFNVFKGEFTALQVATEDE